MPEIKHVFNQGKMNKDLDERLIEKGQYRDAMNIQVSTSEGSDVGAVQNILGNLNLFENNELAPNAKCIGAVADEKENCFYWFVYHSTKSLILQYKPSRNNPIAFVFVDTFGQLEFGNNIITGINVLDDYLFWTDGFNEPKKINIIKSIQGTDQGGWYHTKLVVPQRGITPARAINVKKKHITVIKPAPKGKLVVEPVYEQIVSAKTTFDFGDTGGLLEIGAQDIIEFRAFSPTSSFYKVNDIVKLLDESSTNSIIDDYQVRIKILEDLSFTNNLPANSYLFEVVSISAATPTSSTVYNCETESLELIFPRKFVKFGYRYKYDSNEYSAISSFTDVVFKPGRFEYSPKKAFNTAMENNLVSLKLRNFVTADIPEDVVQIDILYTESDSPVIYLVDKIRFFDAANVTLGLLPSDRYEVNNWNANLYEITADLIYAAIPENQLLRTYDNVPTNALAQEITGNRLVYANYEQNYNILSKPVLNGGYISRYNNNEYYNISYEGNVQNLPVGTKERVVLGEGQKSLKSLRDYQIGVSYLDAYGRQSPIFTSNDSQFKIPKKHAAYKLKIKGQMETSAPVWAEYFKIFVKETSTEYYNLALSRVYLASDGDLWLSFPSAERNKVDEDTFLILKKAADSNELIKQEARYKVLAIENEAPDYIKTEVNPITELQVDTTSSTNNDLNVFSSNGPTSGSRYFDINIQEYVNTNSQPLDEVKDDLYVAFRDSENNYTSRYRIKNVNDNGSEYNITLEDLFKASDASLIYTNYPDTNDNTGVIEIISGIRMVIYSGKIESKPEYKGVFFVKINADAVAQKNIIPKSSAITSYEIKNVAHVHYFSDTAASGITTGTTQSSNTSNGNNTVGRSDSKDEWLGLLDFGGSSNTLFADLSPTPSQTGGFFIDKVSYAGVHPDGTATNDEVNNPNHVRFTRNIDSANSPEFGKGVYQKPNGDWVMELSFSVIDKSASNGKEGIYNGDLKLRNTNNPEIWQPGNSQDSLNRYKTHYGGRDEELKLIVSRLTANSKFKIKNNDNTNQVFTIKEVQLEKRYNHTNYSHLYDAYLDYLINGDYNANMKPTWNRFTAKHNRRITYILTLDSDQDLGSVKISGTDLITSGTGGAAGTSTSVAFQFVDQRVDENVDNIISENPAIFETEPKKTADLDVYYEASDCIPVNFSNNKASLFAPIGSVVTCPSRPDTINPNVVTIVRGWANNIVTFNTPIDLVEYGGPPSLNKPPVRVFFTRPDDSYTSAYIDIALSQAHQSTTGTTAEYVVSQAGLSKNPFALSWFNCYSFNNGVESNRIRDDFNAVVLDKGVKASTTLDEPYRKEKRKSGLIYSGIYNSNSGINNLNQFIQAEKITKDLNPTYGSIQKLFTRQTDLIAFCEDRVVRIQANKDAVFNADGNPQLIATDRVLGQTLPFAGDYGISKNPESFAADNYRVYFTDQQRGAVLRLSMDGLTPISSYGMSDYFKDIFNSNNSIVLGSFDDKKNEYNLTIPSKAVTVSYKESIRGWSSFKSFYPEQSISVGNNYYTIRKGLPYQHHVENDFSGNSIDRNTFYGDYTPSSITFVFNDAPDVVKSFKTLNYEGSQSYVKREITDSRTGYYNLENKDGWTASSIQTNKQEGTVLEFIEKEGKWFNYIKGKNAELKTDEFSFQGIGRATNIDIRPNIYPVVNGCTDPNADNYDATATVDDGSCTYTFPPSPTNIGGCMDPSAPNYDPTATYDDGSCIMTANVVNGCTDPNALNYNPLANVDDGSCVVPVYGCTDPGASNFNVLANVNDGSCTYLPGPGNNPGGGVNNPVAPGCTDPSALNYNPAATVDDGSCVYAGYSITVQDLNDDD